MAVFRNDIQMEIKIWEERGLLVLVSNAFNIGLKIFLQKFLSLHTSCTSRPERPKGSKDDYIVIVLLVDINRPIEKEGGPGLSSCDPAAPVQTRC